MKPLRKTTKKKKTDELSPEEIIILENLFMDLIGVPYGGKDERRIFGRGRK